MLTAWDDPLHPLNHRELELAQTRYGNINTDGSVETCTGHLVPRWHPRFIDAIEPGVRNLVGALIDAGWTTYSSCEGHMRGGGFAPIERNVGLLGRTFDEFLGALQLLTTVAKQVNSTGTTSLTVDCRIAALESDDWTWPALEVWFARDPDASWDQYFAALDGVCETTVSAIRATMR